MCTERARRRRDVDMRRLVVFPLALGLAVIPCPVMGQDQEQEDEREWTSGLLTGVVGGTAASTIAAAGLCALAGLDAGTCAGDGLQYGGLPALASGYGLSYPDRTTRMGRLRTVALGSAGGFLTVLGVWLAVQLDPSVYIASPDRGQFLRATFWGAGVGLMTGFAGPSVQASLFPSASPKARNASPLALGLALRFPLP